MSIPNSPQITTLRLPSGAEVAFVDWQDQPLYSTADLLNGWTDEEIPLFTYSVGDPVSASTNSTVRRIATKRDTNVSTPGSMAGTEEMLVYAIKPEVLSLQTDTQGDVGDLNTMEPRLVGQPVPQVNQLAWMNWFCNLRFIVSQKIMHEASFGYYNTGFGAVSFGGYTGSALPGQRSFGSQGLPSQEAVRNYGIPVHMGSTEKFRLLLVNPNGATINWVDENFSPAPAPIEGLVLSLKVYLDGLYKRPVA